MLHINPSKTKLSLFNEEVKLLWDFTIQTDREIHHRRPDIVIQKKKAKETIIVDIAVPGDSNILQKETEKCEKYQDLAREIQRIWKSRTKVVPVVVGALVQCQRSWQAT